MKNHWTYCYYSENVGGCQKVVKEMSAHVCWSLRPVFGVVQKVETNLKIIVVLVTRAQSGLTCCLLLASSGSRGQKRNFDWLILFANVPQFSIVLRSFPLVSLPVHGFSSVGSLWIADHNIWFDFRIQSFTNLPLLSHQIFNYPWLVHINKQLNDFPLKSRLVSQQSNFEW